MKKLPFRVLDRTGKRYGKLVAISFVRITDCAEWLCKCDCGGKKVVKGQNLHNGGVESCGCIYVGGKTIHGMYGTPEYLAWRAMKSRCRSKNVSHRARFYLKNGIKVCKRWMKFENFFADMGKRPSPSHSLDRVNNLGNYEPPNCRWADRETQQSNKSNNRILSLNGKTLTMSQWAREIGIDRRTLSERLKSGWSVEKALTTKLRKQTNSKP